MLPRERIVTFGVHALSDEELLATIMGTGTKTIPKSVTIKALLLQYPQLAGLDRATTAHLMTIPGIGLSKATLFEAAIELGKRVVRQRALRQGTIVSSQSIGELMQERLAGLNQERLLVLFLDIKNAIIKEEMVSLGTMTASLVDPKVIFHHALLLNAGKFLIVHNHPSGNEQPSAADYEVTKRLHHAGELMGIELIDHLIVGANNYFSFHEETDLLG
ncbi:RadC family protein [Lacticaseibacillus brantae]|uniref:DNA repair protein (RadC) n=1 Tax=Lacticaseibacillus brantae DSM 23927 TaxID=1423727 RepID=A0A0R2B7S8_9LACO|nr:DNA repair protein RadC [Lacticaseibacillus brantae]KRM72491.1 DNA repair protein (RadC) [Lacticaseibacillus brantae DSM 23927]